MFQPKHNGNKSSQEKRYCNNPSCKLKLADDNRKEYCDNDCQQKHRASIRRQELLDRRPKDVMCANCQKPIDPLSKSPYQLKLEKVFCDTICLDSYRINTGFYAEISVKGNKAIEDYKKQNGKVQYYANRAKAVSENNGKAPPKAKWFDRTGKIWGYDVVFAPNQTDDGYLASLPELPEMGIFLCSTVKSGLQAIRSAIRLQRSSQSEVKRGPGRPRKRTTPVDEKEKAKKRSNQNYYRKVTENGMEKRREYSRERYRQAMLTEEGKKKKKAEQHQNYLRAKAKQQQSGD